MKESKNTAPRKSNVTVFPSSNPVENEKQRSLFTPPDFVGLVNSVVEKHIFDILPKSALIEASEDKYDISVILSRQESVKAVNKELQDAAESYAQLKGCDPDLPALLNPPSEAQLKQYLTHEED